MRFIFLSVFMLITQVAFAQATFVFSSEKDVNDYLVNIKVDMALKSRLGDIYCDIADEPDKNNCIAQYVMESNLVRRWIDAPLSGTNQCLNALKSFCIEDCLNLGAQKNYCLNHCAYQNFIVNH